ncbi:hypothetical protein [Pseudomonas sp. NPDC012596]|uniref:hypothetical protein n=1 Tax=Pseudomonas sp. NPDC012596 TaxID=3364419 RepID=UPI003676FB73
MGAFEKQGARLHLIAQVDQETVTLLTSPQGPGSDGVQAMAADTGLTPSFIALLQALGWNDKVFLRAALQGLPTGAEVAALPGRWLAALWDEIGEALEARSEREAVANVLDLHRSAATGVAVNRTVWRKARAAFVGSEAGVPGAVAAIVVATAWDPLTTHGAFADAALLLPSLAEARWEAASGWGAADDEEAQRLDEQAITHGREQAGPTPSEDPGWYNTEEGEAWVQRFLAAYNAYGDTHGQRVRDRHEGIFQGREALQSRAKAILLDLIQGQHLG